MFQEISHADAAEWKPGPYPGVELKLLRKDPITGGVTVLRKFNAGITVPAHIHPQANETAFVLAGDWQEENKTYGPGTCFFAPKGERHGPHHARTEVISLTIFDGPLTVTGG